MQEESIYNLIPKEHIQSPKQPLYKSKFSHTIPPTGSTFGHHTTSVPKISNLYGSLDFGKEAHSRSAEGATFGKPKGSLKPDTQNFTKKATGKMGSTYLPEIKKTFKYDETAKKPAVPKKGEEPIYGLVTGKNYVLSNKIESMLSQPRVLEQPVDWTKKKDYGRSPKYLDRIKEQTLREYEHIKSLQQQEQEQQESEKMLLTEEELQGLREGLKNKWNIVNKEYQLLTFKILDTRGLIRKKEQCEKELSQIEKDLEKLHKGFIFVDTRH